MNLTTECFNNIKMIKLFSWTEIILENIDQRRNKELSILKIRMILGALIVASFYFFPCMLQAVCFSTFIGTGHTLSLSLAFTILNIFSII